ncbi:MAG: hypothetical protein ACXAEI_08680 [Candidatus Hodarchaeales archaeon]|jgi:hypothetical protein
MAIDFNDISPVDNPINFVLTMIVVLIPILLVLYPYILLRGTHRRTAASLYSRFALGYIAFWIGYFLFPAFVLEHDYGRTETLDRGGFFFYLIRLYGASFLLFFQFPLRVFPIIFILAPVLSFLILLIRLKRDRSPEPLLEKLRLLNFEFEENPMGLVKQRLDHKNWTNEKELLIALVAVLPISLYLLTMFLSVLKYADTADAFQKALGWFLEVFFVYLATAIFCIHLIRSAGISFKGEFIGARLRRSMIESLSTVGAFVSVIAVVFFLVEKEELLLVTSYFFVYFLMASILLVLFLDLFEPISIFILTKLVEFTAAAGQRRSRISLKRLCLVVFGGILIGIMGYFVKFGSAIVQNEMLGIKSISRALSPDETGLNVAAPVFSMLNTLYMTVSVFYAADMLQIFVMCTGIVLLRRYNDSILQNIVIVFLACFFLTPLLVSDFVFPVTKWIADEYGTGTLFETGFGITVDGDAVPLIRILIAEEGLKLQTALGVWIEKKFNVDVLLLDTSRSRVYWVSSVGVLVGWRNTSYSAFSGRLTQVDVTGAFPPVLELAYVPYLYLAPLATLALFALVIHLADSKFHVYSAQAEQTVEKAVYSSVHFPIYGFIHRNPERYLVALKPTAIPAGAPEGVIQVANVLAEGEFTYGRLAEQTGLDLPAIHAAVEFLKQHAPANLAVYRKEYGFVFEIVHIDSVHVMMTDGRSVFTWQTGEEMKVEPALVAGLFAAITSFAKEAVHSEQMLKTIDHGDVVLTIEYGQWVFAAVFANKGSAPLRRALKVFLDEFESRHAEELPGWLGDMEPFENDAVFAKEKFADLTG